MSVNAYRRSLLFVLGLGWTGVSAAAEDMKAFRIELPHHEIRFAVPQQLSAEMGPNSVVKSFDPANPGPQGEQRAHFLMDTATDFNGPFWVGAYGSLRFFLTLQRRQPGYDGEITSVAGLDSYMRWWWKTVPVQGREHWRISQSTLSGPAVLREFTNLGTPGETHQIFSLPIEEGYYLDVGLALKEWPGGVGKEKRWLPKAQAMRDAIAATVAVTPKR